MSEVIRKYILVAKPGIIFGNLISTAGGFLLASKGAVDVGLLLATLVGVSLVVASGCVFNNYIDRSIDGKMVRTQNRPLASGLMSPQVAMLYAIVLGAAGTALLLIKTNVLCVAIVLIGFAVYAGVYSFYLKRRSVYAILIGSLAGAAPPLAGYCAVTSSLDTAALILFAIFTLWQVPHSYAIAIYSFEDYAAAHIPVLPVVQGIAAAKKQICCYILGFTLVTPLLTLSGYAGYLFLVVTGAMGIFWLYIAWAGFTTADNRIWAKKLFAFSILLMTVLNVMMSIDVTT